MREPITQFTSKKYLETIKNKKGVKILIFTSKEGHLSIAQAATDTFRKAGYQVKTADFLSRKSFIIRAPFYRYFPSLFKIPYTIGKQNTVQETSKILLERYFREKVENKLKEYMPNLVISTNFAYNPAITKALGGQKTPIPFINIVPDPWAIHPLQLSSNIDLNLVYDKRGLEAGKRYKIPPGKLLNIGWLVRKEFYQKHNLSKIRKDLGFKKNVFTLLVCGGSEGTNAILKIIPAFSKTKTPLQIIIVCGTNKSLYKTLFSLKKIVADKKDWLNLKLFQFTSRLPQFMSIADLIMGKAGPNLLFETVATKKPFFAICHISGQEDANLDLIKEKKLGFVEENSIKATKLLQKIIADPKSLERFLPYIQKVCSQNFQAEKKLLKAVKKLLSPSI